mgnify:CR=1 FL=1
MAAVTPLPADRLFHRCDTANLGFTTTAELEPLTQPLGQDRAVEAVRFGIGIRSEGFNMFCLGPDGAGKTSLVRQFLGSAAGEQPTPDDWVYVNNFDSPYKPWPFSLPAGRAREFSRDMDNLVEELQAAIPAAFEGEEYRSRRHAIEEEFKEAHEKSFGDVQKRANEQNIAIMRTPVGLAMAPMRDGEVLSPEDFQKLPEEEQEDFRQRMSALQEELEKSMQELPKVQKEHREKLKQLNQEFADYAARHAIDELKQKYSAIQAVQDHLEAVRADVVENAGLFLQGEEGESEDQEGQAAQGGQQGQGGMPQAMMAAGGGPRGRPSPFNRYKVNVLVDNSENQGAPVVFEDHPTQPNLVGRIDHLSIYGTLTTDFTLIKSGALQRANGGYLILEARKLLMQPFAYEDMKRALRSREIRIESPGQSLGMFSTVSLEPQAIPLDVKVVLIGDPMLYYLLAAYDPEFRELFKVAADFDTRMERDAEAVTLYARLLGSLARGENLMPLEAAGVARVVEHASRLAEDAEKLSIHMSSVGDLVREADYWARRDGAEAVGADHVQQAIDHKEYRSNRIRQRLQEEILRGTIHVDTEGATTGQVNGLAVLQLGDYAFGKPGRITCRVRPGKGDVTDIEREVQMGGPIHAKGVLILSSFLASRFALDTPLSLSASLVFEQSYSGIEGDSASSAELYALLSALADTPIKQGLAVTGAVSQYGEVQAIGGVNEKIEGFFDVCQGRGLTGDQGVLIPAPNAKHLMLRQDVVDACREGRFHIYPVATIDEGIALLTGVPAGEPDGRGEYPLGTINRRVAARLSEFHRKAQTAALGMIPARSQQNNDGGGRS